MATLHLELTLELTNDYNYVVKESYKVKTVKEVANITNNRELDEFIAKYFNYK